MASVLSALYSLVFKTLGRHYTTFYTAYGIVLELIFLSILRYTVIRDASVSVNSHHINSYKLRLRRQGLSIR